MKKSLFLFLVIALTSCSSYQYTARQVNVDARDINQKEQSVKVKVDYKNIVTATSDYQVSRKEAIAEAEYMCIQNSKIDVVVDPIFKVEYNISRTKNRYRATIVGYAGMYEETQSALDDSKKYTLEEVEKYKLLTDPDFPRYYYSTGAQSENYFINTNSSKEQGAKQTSQAHKKSSKSHGLKAWFKKFKKDK